MRYDVPKTLKGIAKPRDAISKMLEGRFASAAASVRQEAKGGRPTPHGAGSEVPSEAQPRDKPLLPHTATPPEGQQQ